MRDRLASRIRRFLSPRKNIRDPFFSIGSAEPRSGSYELGEIALVCRGKIPLAQRFRKDASDLAVQRGTVRVWLLAIRTEQGINKIRVGIELPPVRLAPVAIAAPPVTDDAAPPTM